MEISLSQAIVLGVIQGVGEFLPISSSAHLALAQRAMGLPLPLFADILLHLATLLSVIVVFSGRIFRLAKDWRGNLPMIKMLLTATAVTALAGVFFEGAVGDLFLNPGLVGVFLVVNGGILFLNYPKLSSFQMNLPRGLSLGLAQSLALFPGISRSGSTITIGRLLGMESRRAFEFSFFLYLPAVLGATFLEAVKRPPVAGAGFVPLVAGFLVAFLVGCFSLLVLRRAVSQGNLWVFAPYCVGLGLLVLFSQRLFGVI